MANPIGERRDQLRLVLDAILPGDADWPAAGAVGLDRAVIDDVAEGSVAADAIGQILDALPADFAGREATARVAALKDVEGRLPQAFAATVAVAYTQYYIDGRVLAVLGKLTGYDPRPPQPLGHELEPFDESILEKARQRAPFYTKV